MLISDDARILSQLHEQRRCLSGDDAYHEKVVLKDGILILKTIGVPIRIRATQEYPRECGLAVSRAYTSWRSHAACTACQDESDCGFEIADWPDTRLSDVLDFQSLCVRMHHVCRRLRLLCAI